MASGREPPVSKAELRLESADRDAHVHLSAEAREQSLPAVELIVRGELVDSSDYESYRARYRVEIHTEVMLSELRRFASSLKAFNETRLGTVVCESLGRAYVNFGLEAARPGRISFFLRQRSLDTGDLVLDGRFPVDSEQFLDILARVSHFVLEIGRGVP